VRVARAQGYANIVHWDDVPKRKDVFLLDCREDGEFANGAYPGAVSMPLSRIRGMMDQIPKDKEIWVYCQSGYATT
jgi:rhodanese-related sulfurtransferase